jgi:ADP-dependent NAD(P)H-hydrate dehydratase / NAD(P)H-hydrate epimerase
MIPVLTSAQIRKADDFTIKNEPVSSTDLMERAARACFELISEQFELKTSFTVVCGQGNNGGDGLAIARMLSEKGYKTDVCILKLRPEGSPDFEINMKRLHEVQVPIHVFDKTPPGGFFTDNGILIDAIFGTGLNKPAEGIAANVIHMMNTSGATIISVDMPSGLFSEESNKHISERNTIRANHTLTFQVPKLSFLLPDSGSFTGDFTILDIGLDKQYIETAETKYHLLPKDFFPLTPLHRRKFSHKGHFGHALLIAGSKGKTGAAVLAAHACLRSGAGLVTVHVPNDSVSIIQTAIPEAMVIADKNSDFITKFPDLSPFSVTAIGPGIGTAKETADAFKLLIQNSTRPLVIDADAINILAENKTWLSFLPPGSVLTPHPGEFERLFGKTESNFDRLKLQQEMSFKYNIIIVLKGAHTSVSLPEGKVYFNSTGNAGMATAGSGDVLTGIITGLLVQTNAPVFSSLAGVFLHGKAGDLAAEQTGLHSLIAGDIIRFLPDAFLSCD